jgi:hypothetical protein
MNRIFSINPEDAWPDFPLRSYARLDHHEPDDLTTAQEAVFSFDAVDAGWFGFPLNERMDLGKPVDTRDEMRDFWAQLFKGYLGPPKDPFDEMPIYNIEVTSKKGDRYWDVLIAIGEEDWLDIELGDTGRFPVDVYGSLLAAPVIAHLLALLQVTGDTAAALSNAFDVDAWPDAADGDVDAILSGVGTIDMLAMYDIGQGSAIGLLDSSETARLYFDLGAGAYGNRQTRPRPLRFCWRGSPSIVLSHWDTDHWAGETAIMEQGQENGLRRANIIWGRAITHLLTASSRMVARSISGPERRGRYGRSATALGRPYRSNAAAAPRETAAGSPAILTTIIIRPAGF